MKITRTIMKSIEKHVRVFIECFPPLPRRIKKLETVDSQLVGGEKKNVMANKNFRREWGRKIKLC